jgi:hypothetical protein
MPGAFLWDERVARAQALSAVGAQPVASLPLSNLLDPQPRHRTRWLGSAASVLVDFGADTAIDAVALLSTTLGAADTVRWRVGALEGLVEAAPLFDLRFTSPGTLTYPTGWAFNRASAGWNFDATGTLVQAAADVPRFDHDPATLACRGILLEEARTNGLRNPRAEGAVAGAPGTAPTNWAATANSGVSASIAGTGTEAGIPYIDVRFAGTASANASLAVKFENNQTAAAAQGQTWTASAFLRLVGGAFGTTLQAPQFILQEYNGAGSYLAQAVSVLSPVPSSGPLAAQRRSMTATLGNAATAWTGFLFFVAYASGAVVDFTLRIGLPQIEQGPCPSSPILPPAGTPGVAIRAADQARIAGLAIGPATLLVECENRGSIAGTAVPAGYGPSDSFDNSSYFSISTTGTCSWIGRAGGVGYNPATIAGSVGAQIVLVGSADIAGRSFARNAAQTIYTGFFHTPVGMDRVSLGGAPWGATPGLATGIGTYRRLALFGNRLLDTQVLQLGATGSSLVPAAVAHDSGVLAAATDGAFQGNVVLLRASAATGRWLLVDVAAPGAALIDIGRLVAGPLWRVSRAVAYGVQEGRETLDRRDRNPLTGAEFPVPALANPRVARFTLPLLTAAEIRTQHRALLAALGGAGEALWIPETGLSLAELNARSIWGAVAAPGEEALAIRDSPAGTSRSFRITERT